MDVAHAVLIEIGKGQGLQVVKAPLAKFPGGTHLNDDCQGAGNVVGACGYQNGQHIQHQEDTNGIKSPQPYIVIQGIALKQGQNDVC